LTSSIIAHDLVVGGCDARALTMTTAEERQRRGVEIALHVSRCWPWRRWDCLTFFWCVGSPSEKPWKDHRIGGGCGRWAYGKEGGRSKETAL